MEIRTRRTQIDQPTAQRLDLLNQAVTGALGSELGYVHITSSRRVKVTSGIMGFKRDELYISRGALDLLSDPQLQALAIRQRTADARLAAKDSLLIRNVLVGVTMVLPSALPIALGWAYFKMRKVAQQNDRRVNVAAVKVGVPKGILATAIEKDQSRRYLADSLVGSPGSKSGALLKRFAHHDGRQTQAAQVRQL